MEKINRDELIKEKEKLLQSIELLEHETFEKSIEIDKLNKELSKMYKKLLELNDKLYD